MDLENNVESVKNSITEQSQYSDVYEDYEQVKIDKVKNLDTNSSIIKDEELTNTETLLIELLSLKE